MTEGSFQKLDTDDAEIGQLLEVIYEKYDLDFRNYSQAHVKRRLCNRMSLSGIPTLKELRYKILDSQPFAALLLKDLSINVTEMFRDPEFYLFLRTHIIPTLRTYSFFKIWHAGCSTGQEVYSMAILLKEENLYERCLLYATDFNQEVLNQAQEGIYNDERIKEYTRAHQLSGGKSSLSDYYTSKYGRVIMENSLKKNIVWANHNLVTDQVFAEVNLIMCRNVLIYFNRDLQNKVHTLFYDSLAHGGFLCLGTRESLKQMAIYDKYTEADKINKIYTKRY